MATMSQAIKEAFGKSGGALSREAIKQSVESRYPGKWESPQMRVGSGGASSMPPQQRNSIEINAPGEWKP